MEQAFKDFYYHYFDKLHAYSFTIVLDNAEAKDIVQLAFIKLWEKRMKLDLRDGAKPYLYATVYNLSLNALRNKKVRDKYKASVEAKNISAYNYSEEKELTARITLGIEDLPAKCKEVFKKSRYEGMKYAEIASDLGISVKTVEVHMTKALKLLREKLADLAIIL